MIKKLGIVFVLLFIFVTSAHASAQLFHYTIDIYYDEIDEIVEKKGYVVGEGADYETRKHDAHARAQEIADDIDDVGFDITIVSVGVGPAGPAASH